MRSSRLIQLVALVCCGVLVYGAATRIPAINQGRRELNVLGAEDPLKNAPPEYVFYIQAFGAFRGLIADIAFIRADQLKEQGRFYDAMQLHKWICELQPRFPAVWEYAAWNMSWNISVTTFTPEERWNWVYNGVKLLRDDGLRINPRAVNLYRQLAWTFNNKMGATTDEFHFAYKRNWAWRMHLLLGPPPDPLAGLDRDQLADQITTTEQTDLLEEAGRLTLVQNEEKRRASAARRKQEFTPREAPGDLPDQSAGAAQESEFKLAQWAAADFIGLIAAAPDKLAGLYEEHPETRRMVSELRGLGIGISDAELTEDDYWRDEGLAFAFFKPCRELVSPNSTLARVSRRARTSYAAQARMDNLARTLGLKDNNPAGEALVRFLQKKALLEVYKLDPAYMRDLVDTFGPLDWRSVDAHSLYWTARGLIAGGESINEFGNDKTNTARVIFFSLRNLLLHNHIIFEPNPEDINRSYLNLGRDLNFIGPMHEAYIKYGPLFDPDTGGVGGAGDTYRSGHVNFLTEAIRLLYISGREGEAARFYDYLRGTYPLNPAGRPNPAFQKSLHGFVMDSLRESLQAAGLREMMIYMEGTLFDAYNELANGEMIGYARRVGAAREHFRAYMRDKWDDPLIQRVVPPKFIDLQIDTFRTWLRRDAINSSLTLHKARLWRYAPLYLRQSIYDDLLAKLTSECDYWGFDVTKAFPEPKDMAEYRARHPDRHQPERAGQIENLPRGPQE